MRHKDTYLIELTDSERPGVKGIGECALFRGLSADDVPDFEQQLDYCCRHPEEILPMMSAIRFGFETAKADLDNGGKRLIFPSDWLEGNRGIEINGLVWMGDKATMINRVEEKIGAGFKVLKLKIGGINFEDELEIISSIRKRFSADELELRLDANGSFTPFNALERLERLSKFDIHSLEQPIKAGQVAEMSRICRESPIKIALDEELIGCRPISEMSDLISYIKPAYIILKPSLCGGFEQADRLIGIAEQENIGWWATSALESNIGLNAIAQWVAAKRLSLPQGLGTGELYHNNITSPLTLKGSSLYYNPEIRWQI